MRTVLEKALVAEPDDLAAHSAYADLLMEQNDPRGEFIQVQLLLEDPSRSTQERAQLRHREKELLEQHARSWLGDAGRFLVGAWSGPDQPFDYRFARGWVDLVRVLPCPDAAVAALARSPEARLLRRLEIVYDMRFHPFDFDLTGPNAALKEGETANEMYEGADLMPALLESPYLTNLRVFKLGFSDDEPLRHSTMVMPFEGCDAHHVMELMGKCPRMEELYLNTSLANIADLFDLPELGKLRVLQYYFGNDYASFGSPNPVPAYPLAALADNVSMQKLTTLRLHAGRDTTIDIDEMDAVLRSRNLPSLTHLQVHMTAFGDEGARRVVESGALRRLKVLDLGYGNMTDDGARLLAASPDIKHLDVLDVSRNALTAAGIAALTATGIQVVVDDQHDADGQEYLYEVDVE